MKKHFVISIAIVLFPLIVLGQTKFKVVKRYNNILTLHASLHKGTGEGSRDYVPVTLPPHTIRWYYAFYASKVPSEAQNAKDLEALASKVSKVYNAAISVAVDGLNKTADAIDCDAYLLRSENDKNLFMGNKPCYSDESCSLPHSMGSTAIPVENSNYLSGTQYLGFVNNNWRDAVYIDVQVVAVVSVPATKNGWSADQKNEMYNYVKQFIISKDKKQKLSTAQLNDFCACYIGKLTTAYSFGDFTAMAEYERNQALKPLAEECEKELSLD